MKKTDCVRCRDLILNTLAKSKTNSVVSLTPSKQFELAAKEYLTSTSKNVKQGSY